jgi:HAD superfamily hydrolase (TIGR01549 family)
MRSKIDIDATDFLSNFRYRMNTFYSERASDTNEHPTLEVVRSILAEWGHSSLPNSVLRPAVDDMFEVIRDYFLPKADALPTVVALHQQGVKIGIISNSSHDPDVHAQIDKAGLRPYLDFILTSASIGVRKPNSLIFRNALDLLDLDPTHVAMVGDSIIADIKGAQDSGLFAIWITRRTDPKAMPEGCRNICPDAVIASLGELHQALANLRIRNEVS